MSKNYRCIALDHLGFGLSEKPKDFTGTPKAHATNLLSFIKSLELEDITLIVHDFGGPIGLGAALRCSDKIENIVLFNTWLWETKSNKKALKVDKLLHSRLGRLLYLNLNFSPKTLLKMGITDKKNLSKKTHKQYLAPFPTKESRYSLLKIGKSLVGASEWYETQWQKIKTLKQKKWLFLWGTKDQFITEESLGKWLTKLPDARVKKYDSGHFLQEEKSNETLKDIIDFLSLKNKQS